MPLTSARFGIAVGITLTSLLGCTAAVDTPEVDSAADEVNAATAVCAALKKLATENVVLREGVGPSQGTLRWSFEVNTNAACTETVDRGDRRVSLAVTAHQVGVDLDGVDVMARRTFSAPAKLDASRLVDVTKLAFDLAFDSKTLFDAGLRDIDQRYFRLTLDAASREDAPRGASVVENRMFTRDTAATYRVVLAPSFGSAPSAAACADPLFSRALHAASALDGVWVDPSAVGGSPLALAFRAEGITCGTFAKKPFAVVGFTRWERNGARTEGQVTLNPENDDATIGVANVLSGALLGEKAARTGYQLQCSAGDQNGDGTPDVYAEGCHLYASDPPFSSGSTNPSARVLDLVRPRCTFDRADRVSSDPAKSGGTSLPSLALGRDELGCSPLVVRSRERLAGRSSRGLPSTVVPLSELGAKTFFVRKAGGCTALASPSVSPPGTVACFTGP